MAKRNTTPTEMLPDSVQEAEEFLRTLGLREATPGQPDPNGNGHGNTAAPVGEGEGNTAADGAAPDSTPPEPVEDTPAPETTDEGNTAPVGEAPEAAQIAAMQAELATARSELARVQHQYDVLRGKEYAEVPRMAQEIRALKEQLAAMQAAPPKPKAPTPDPDPQEMAAALDLDYAQLVEDDGKEYGEQQIRRMWKTHQAAVKAASAQIEAFRASQAQTVRPLFEQGLAAQVPAFQELRQYSAEFETFLDWPEPFSGRPYREHYAAAESAGDVMRAAQVWNAFDMALTPVAAPPAAPVPAPKAPGRPPVDPKPSTAAAPVEKPKKKTYTPKEWDAAMAALSGKEQTPEGLKQRNELAAAVAEGRVRAT